MSLAGNIRSLALALISLALIVGLATPGTARGESIELVTGDKLESVEILEKGEAV